MTRSGQKLIGLWMIVAIAMSAAVVPASDYSFFTPLREARIVAHNQVVAHTASAPARYRVLVPVALEAPIALLARVRPYEKAFERVYGAFHFLALSLILIVLVAQLSLWFTTEQALVGALIVGGLLQLALRQQEYDLSAIPGPAVFVPQSLLEPVIVAAAYLLAWRGWKWWLALLVAVAALNSEASVVIPFLYLAVAKVNRASVIAALAYACIWGVMTLAIHLVLGGNNTTTLGQIWRENVQHLATASINIALFLGPLWIIALVGLRSAPAAARRAAWLIAPYLAAVGAWGSWQDIRLLLGLYPLAAPLVLSALFEPRPDTDPEACRDSSTRDLPAVM